MAFQSYAFQIGAFQYNTTGGSSTPTQHNTAGYPPRKKHDYWPDQPWRHETEATKYAVENLPHKIKQAIKTIAKKDIKKNEREAALLAEIEHIDSAFQLLYLNYLELLHADWIERELARLFAEKQMALQIRQNEEALIFLLLL